MTITAAAWRLDGNYVSLLHLPADLRPQLFIVQEVASDPASLPATGAPRPVASAVGEQGEAGGF
jgi:hypothetical protein